MKLLKDVNTGNDVNINASYTQINTDTGDGTIAVFVEKTVATADEWIDFTNAGSKILFELWILKHSANLIA